jgi:predicted DNA-binding transcriptional regulator AlpA
VSKGRYGLDAAKKKAAARKRAAHARAARIPPPTEKPELTDDAPSAGGRLLDKPQVCKIANVTYPTIWAWMRAGKFPRARIVGGKSMWLSTEIDAWLAALPERPLKGDPGSADQ